MTMRVSSMLVALALALFVVGCGSAPQTELKASEDALAGAQTAEAEQYAPASYQVALDSLNAAKVEIQKQDSKFSLFRSYGHSKELLASAQKLAEQAVSEAQTAKEETRVQDSLLIAEVDVLLASAQAAVAGAPRGKGTKADIELIKADLSSVEQAIASAKADYEAGKYLVVKSKLDASVTQLNRVIADVDAAKAKAAGKN